MEPVNDLRALLRGEWIRFGRLPCRPRESGEDIPCYQLVCSCLSDHCTEAACDDILDELDDRPCVWSKDFLEAGKKRLLGDTRREATTDEAKLENYYMPWELDRAIARFVAHYSHRRYHEALEDVTPADVHFGRRQEILSRRERIKRETLTQRNRENLRAA